MAKKNIPGHQGTLARADGGAWKPIVCLTSSSYQAVLNMTEKVNMCTQGEVKSSPQSLTRTVSINAEVIDTSDVGGSTAQESLDELRELQESYVDDREPSQWRLSRGPLGYLYFDGYISDLSDDFQASEDATFSAQLTVESKPTKEDPLEG